MSFKSATRLSTRLASRRAATTIQPASRRHASTESAKKSGDTQWIIGSAVVFGSLGAFLLYPSRAQAHSFVHDTTHAATRAEINDSAPTVSQGEQVNATDSLKYSPKSEKPEDAHKQSVKSAADLPVKKDEAKTLPSYAIENPDLKPENKSGGSNANETAKNQHQSSGSGSGSKSETDSDNSSQAESANKQSGSGQVQDSHDAGKEHEHGSASSSLKSAGSSLKSAGSSVAGFFGGSGSSKSKSETDSDNSKQAETANKQSGSGQVQDSHGAGKEHGEDDNPEQASGKENGEPTQKEIKDSILRAERTNTPKAAMSEEAKGHDTQAQQ
ncbi:uncharacterized protein IL334_007700 [Kwoniella shivajii]|uniref:Uncharacterized protein n=1 Tax=Kwoniella shivajii TaxID=564305 RepID=A0ABZ1D9E3_9TREE|nr:hypothetical protein IL334_007700 [Kwoniella shivajii]